jgi:hypothetical protein
VAATYQQQPALSVIWLISKPPPDLNLAIIPAVPVISPRLLYVVESDEPSALRKLEPNPPIISNLAALINPFYLMW